MKAGETDIDQYNDLVQLQKDFDDKITGSMNNVRDDIAAKLHELMKALEAVEAWMKAARMDAEGIELLPDYIVLLLVLLGHKNFT